MSLIEQFPQVGAATGGGGSGSETFTGTLAATSQSITLSGTTPTIAATPPVARITGSTGSTTVAMPAAPSTGQICFIDNQATVSFTLSGNGNNVDGAASKTVATSGPVVLWYTGAAWESLAWPQYLLDTRYGVLGSSNSWTGGNTFNGAATFSKQTVLTAQAASTASFSVVAANGPYIESTYSPTGAQTLTMPSSPTTNQVIWLVDEGLDAAANNITVSGNGKNINGSASITLAKNGAAVAVRYSGSNWFIVSAYNYP